MSEKTERRNDISSVSFAGADGIGGSVSMIQIKDRPDLIRKMQEIGKKIRELGKEAGE